MADLLLQERNPTSSVGPNWLTRFVRRHDELMSKYLRKYDHQRAKCEDPETIGKWFELVRATIAKYGIAAEDIYNFDETGFQMGVIATAKVITRSSGSASLLTRRISYSLSTSGAFRRLRTRTAGSCRRSSNSGFTTSTSQTSSFSINKLARILLPRRTSRAHSKLLGSFRTIRRRSCPG
jgi:hypothetical protein